MSDRRRDLGALETAWEGVKNMASSAWQAMLNIGREDSLETKLKNARERLAALQDKAVERYGGVDKVPERAAALRQALQTTRDQIQALEQQIDLENKAADAASKRARTEQEKIDRINSGQADREASAQLDLRLQKEQNASAARVALQEQQKARLEGLHRAQLIDDESFARRKSEIEQEILAEQARLIQAEIDIEKRRPVKAGDAVAAAQQQVKLLQLQAKLAENASQSAIAGIGAKFVAPKTGAASEYDTALSGLGAQSAKLKFQADNIAAFGEKVTSAQLAVTRFEVEQGRFKDLADSQKKALLDAAQAVDDYSAALARAQAGMQFQRGTDEIVRQTAELGQNALQRKINADLQALENAGIKKGTEEYERLSAARRKALQDADAASRSIATGLQDGLNSYLDTITNQAATARDALVNAFRGAEDAMVSFVTKGKADFKGLVNSMIADLARIAIRQALSSSGGGNGGILSSLVGAAVNYFSGGSTGGNFTQGMNAAVASGWTYPGRASGGRAQPFATYRVNETGTETLTMGSQGGYIMNAKQTRAAQAGGGAGSGKSIVVNFNQSNNIGSNVSRAEISQALAQAKEQGKAELMDTLQRRGVI